MVVAYFSSLKNCSLLSNCYMEGTTVTLYPSGLYFGSTKLKAKIQQPMMRPTRTIGQRLITRRFLRIIAVVGT